MRKKSKPFIFCHSRAGGNPVLSFRFPPAREWNVGWLLTRSLKWSDAHIKMDFKYPLKINDRLWVLGNYYFNIYLVIGDNRSAIIETGVSAVVDTVISQLEALAVSPDYLILTHPHTDHFTGLPGLHERYPEALIIAHKEAEGFISHPKAERAMLPEDRFISEQLAKRGFVPGRVPLIQISFPGKYEAVEQSQDIDIGNITLSLFQAKGHSPGNLVAHVPELHAVFTSDSLGFHYPGRGFCPLYFTGFIDYLSTLERLSAMEAEIVCPGHQGPILGSDVQATFAMAKEGATMIHRQIRKARMEREELAANLFARFYKDEFTIYGESNIRNCMNLLIKRSVEVG